MGDTAETAIWCVLWRRVSASERGGRLRPGRTHEGGEAAIEFDATRKRTSAQAHKRTSAQAHKRTRLDSAAFAVRRDEGARPRALHLGEARDAVNPISACVSRRLVVSSSRRLVVSSLSWPNSVATSPPSRRARWACSSDACVAQRALHRQAAQCARCLRGFSFFVLGGRDLFNSSLVLVDVSPLSAPPSNVLVPLNPDGEGRFLQCS
jgi:hypothetical protein